MRTDTGFRTLLAIASAFALAFAGCGDDGDSGSTDATTGGTTGGETTAGSTEGTTTEGTTTEGTTTEGTTTEGTTTEGTTTEGTTTEGTTTEGTTTEGGTTTGEPEEECKSGSSCFNGECCSCAPVGCKEGIDNSLSGLSGLANSSLQGAIDDASVNLMAELNFVKDGEEFALNMYTAEIAPETTCENVAGDLCDWEIALSSFTEECVPLIAFANAKIEGTKLTAGGKDGLFQLAIPIQGLVLELTVTLARIEGEVIRDGDKIVGVKGILAGAIPKKTLEEAVDNLPDEGLPISKEAIKGILANVVKSDIDGLDADGEPCAADECDGVVESASVAIIFEAIPANITAVEQPATEGETTGDEPPVEEPVGCAAPPAVDSFSAFIFRLNKLALGDSGKPGQGLDVDGICHAPVADDGEMCFAPE